MGYEETLELYLLHNRTAATEKKNVNRAQCDNYIPDNNAQNQNRKHTNVLFTWGNINPYPTNVENRVSS